jgi:hypothetical protein
LDNLPNGIKRIILKNNHYNEKLNSLPNSVEYIKLNKNYNLQIEKLPRNLSTIEFYKYYKFRNDFTNGKINLIEY